MMKLITLFLLAALSAGAQTNLTPANPPGADSNPPQQTNGALDVIQLGEQMRAQCIEGRRRICGKILKLLPDGLVIESGYTNLLRDPLTKSWLVRGTVEASLASNLLESSEPGGICVGRVVLTDVPKSRSLKPALYDYIIIEAYPTGQYTYATLGTIRHTVRRFSASLEKAVEINVDAELQKPAAAATVK
jgi:hypothetical protein